VSGELAIEARAALREFDLEVSLRVAAGERMALVGPSGAGKTTVLRIIAGLLAVAEGRISLGADVWLDTAAGRDVPPEERRCGYLFQDYALFPQMRAWRNVAFGMRNGQRARRRDRATELLARFGAAELADALPIELSGGERQRVALARALASEPEALLLDEPLSALDPATRSRSLRELDAMLAELGVPILLVTHSFEEAALLGDRVAVIDRGRIVQTGTPGEISGRPRSPFVADFAGACVLTGTARRDPDGLTRVRLDGAGELRSTDEGSGPVAVSVYPWEISLEPAGTSHVDSALNRVAGEVASVTEIGNRVRVVLATPQPLTVEITGRSADALGIEPGARLVAAWKATATRLIETAPREDRAG
jgi:molybdate transport system ATP-binding protein